MTSTDQRYIRQTGIIHDDVQKRIAVVGNGSSGSQILPELTKLEGIQSTIFQ